MKRLDAKQREMKARRQPVNPRRKRTRLQEAQMAALRAAGWTLQEIADSFCLSRSGVLRILRRYD